MDISVCAPSSKAFHEITKVLTEDDLCPICYDDMTISQGPLSCPCCKNCIHKVCMEVWLENKDTCVYCRSDIWKTYEKSVIVEIHVIL